MTTVFRQRDVEFQNLLKDIRYVDEVVDVDGVGTCVCPLEKCTAENGTKRATQHHDYSNEVGSFMNVL